MDWVLGGKALLLGIVEGLTEFLPISSTGHLIVVGSLLDFNGARAKTFHIVIQFGAILAVCWEYRQRIATVLLGFGREVAARRFVLNVVIATIPTAVLGLMFEASIKKALFSPVPVAFALVAGGVLIWWVEARARECKDARARVRTIDELSWRDALKVGCAQCCALIPGVSRSGSTIIGAMLFGVDRRVATEFSFFLAIPIIVGATLFEFAKNGRGALMDNVELFTLGTVAAFVSAFACVRWLLRYIATHDFTIFAWYRIVFGMIVLMVGYGGGLEWFH